MIAKSGIGFARSSKARWRKPRSRTTLDAREGVDYAVDVNPRRSGTFIAGTRQRIVTPEFLAPYRPDVVIVMSPIYLPEIRAQLDSMGVRPQRLITVEAPEQLAAA